VSLELELGLLEQELGAWSRSLELGVAGAWTLELLEQGSCGWSQSGTHAGLRQASLLFCSCGAALQRNISSSGTALQRCYRRLFFFLQRKKQKEEGDGNKAAVTFFFLLFCCAAAQ